jgi:hypothetical protein
MPVEMGIWKIGVKPVRLVFSPMNAEERLEDILASDIAILDPDLLLIGRQVPTAYGKFIDLLAIDREGNLVVIELKRDKTPREVVAQVLDYGSWVAKLQDAEIAAIFEDFIKQHAKSAPDMSLDAAFCKKFNVNAMPQALNESHELLIVATKLDDSTERIIAYLTDYGVAINAAFFHFFKEGDGEFLTRAWLIQPEAAEEKVKETREKIPWNGEFYVSFGHSDKGRHWEDARKYGFISAGGGEWYSRTLGILEPGGRIWVNVPQTGYVGVGVVEQGPVLPKDFMVEDKPGHQVPITSLPIRGNLVRPLDNPENTDEYLVRVRWIKTVPLSEALSEKGFFGNQNSAARPRAKNWIYTIERLKIRFGIVD